MSKKALRHNLALRGLSHGNLFALTWNICIFMIYEFSAKSTKSFSFVVKFTKLLYSF